MRDDQWTSWMRCAIAGDTRSYHQLLTALTPHLRLMVRKRCDRFGVPHAEVEDLVQEVLLAIHLKRGSWDPSRPLGPWISAIVRHKFVDCLRSRGRHIGVPFENVEFALPVAPHEGLNDRIDIERLLKSLKEPQRQIVRSISLEGRSTRETADRLRMTEIGVRVALHRALKSLASMSGVRTAS